MRRMVASNFRHWAKDICPDPRTIQGLFGASYRACC